MNSSAFRTGILILVGLALIVLYSSVFIVQQTQYALVLRFGAVQSEIREPGLKFKLPLLPTRCRFRAHFPNRPTLESIGIRYR